MDRNSQWTQQIYSKTNTFLIYKNDPDNPDSISGDSVTSICEDDYGYLWIGTQTGLNRLDIDTMIYHTYSSDIYNQNSISSGNITTLYKDTEGILWIGTTNGINKLDLCNQFFKNYTEILSNPILGILDAGNDSLWLEVGEDLVLFNINSGIVENIYYDVFKGQNYSNPTYNIICLGIDGSIWFGQQTLD